MKISSKYYAYNILLSKNLFYLYLSKSILMRNIISCVTSKSFISIERKRACALEKSLLMLVFALINLFGSNSHLNAQVNYGAGGNFGLRKVVPTYTGNAIQVRRECDNALTNIGFTSCGTLDTITLKNFVLTSNPLSAISPSAQGAYSLRKLRCAYAGSAINVRRSCDNATRDIGFTANGDLDTISLKAFVMASNPLSALSVSVNVAYSLRRLRCAFAGSAIQVRRSSDNATSNIGFTAAGDLDTAALKTFVGVGNSGFVSIWYDQSGNGINVSPPATSNQPRIVNAGFIERRNGLPSIFFDGVDDYFTTSSFPTTGYTGFTANLLASWTTVGASIGNIQTLIDNDHNCTKGFVVQDRPDLLNKPLTLTVINPTACTTYQIADVLTTGNGALRLITYVNNTTSHAGYRDGNLMGSAVYTGVYVIGSRFLIGAWHNGGSITRYTNGHILEVNIFKSALSNTDRQYLEWGQSQYYNITGPTLSSTLPAATPSAFVATWYDQSGNARHATQATSGLQPRIINAGVIEKNSSNRPSIFFNGTYLKNAFFLTTQPVSTSCVWRARGLASPGGELFGWGANGVGGSRYGVWFAFSSSTQGVFGVENLGAGTVGSSLLNTNTWYISSQLLPGSSLPALTQWINGTSQALTNIGSPAAMNITAGEFAIGTIPTANVQGHNGDIQELVYFSSALSGTDRQYIEYGQSVYYGISGPTVPSTVPVNSPSAYVSIWYDQSGNGRDARQPATGNQPKIVNSGVTSLQNGKPAISLDGTSTWLIQSTITVTQPYSLNVIATRTANGGSMGYQRLVNISSTSDSFGFLGALAGNYATFNGNGAGSWNDLAACTPSTGIALNSQAILTMVSATGATGLIPSANGSELNLKNGTSVVGTGFLLGGAYNINNTSQLWPGNLSEFHIFSSALSKTRRTLIETNQSAFYSIAVSNSKYTPPTSSSYVYHVNGVGRESATDSIVATRQSSGMGFRVNTGASDFLKDNGDYFTCGINCPITPTISALNLPPTVIQRWLNDWYITKTDISSNNGLVTIYFDYSEYGVGGLPGIVANYVLLYRNSPAGTFSIVPSTTPSVIGDQVRFAVDASNILTNHYYTIGTLNPAVSPLPIGLLGFSGNCDGNTATLKWSTATEKDNDYFTIERAKDGVNYHVLDIGDGAENSVKTLNYSFIDLNPIEGISYYRLKQTDFDGKFKYSASIVVQCDNKLLEVQVYPNPVTNELTVEMPGNNEFVNFEIINSMGAIIYKGSFIEKTTIQTSGFAAGIYVIKFANTYSSEFKKVIKQ
jgi:hypothetical protein